MESCPILKKMKNEIKFELAPKQPLLDFDLKKTIFDFE